MMGKNHLEICKKFQQKKERNTGSNFGNGGDLKIAVNVFDVFVARSWTQDGFSAFLLLGLRTIRRNLCRRRWRCARVSFPWRPSFRHQRPPHFRWFGQIRILGAFERPRTTKPRLILVLGRRRQIQSERRG
jgi:hypothetical protein